jgi:hypothetical protein
MARNWTKVEVEPQDVLDGAKSLSRRSQVWTLNVVPTWVNPEEYLSWAGAGLKIGNQMGYDMAVCYAKRAVCQLIDALMHYNHLRKWVRSNYPPKIDMLKEVGIEVKSVVRDLIIDSRNDIEHNYSVPSESQARHAVDLAEMAISPLVEQARVWATVTLGLNYAGNHQAPDPAAESGYSSWNYNWEADVPFLLVDYADPIPRVMLIFRKDEEVRFAPLDNFEVDQAIELARQLREQHTSGGGFRIGYSHPFMVDELKKRLELAF